MKEMVQAEIEKAVRHIWIGLAPHYLVSASFKPGNIRVEVLPEECARARQLLKARPQDIVDRYRKKDVRRVRRDLEARARKFMEGI